MKNLAFLVLLIILAGSLTSCDSDNSSDSDDYFGTYTLQSINGLSMPFLVYEDDSGKVEIVGGSITVNSNMTFSTTTTLRTNFDGNIASESETETGTYTKSGSTFTYTFNDDPVPQTGTLSGDTITIVAESMTIVFKK